MFGETSDGTLEEGDLASPLVRVNLARLIEARVRMSLDVSQAAERLGVRAERLAAWEAGTVFPTVNQVRNVSQLYRQTLAHFISVAPPPLATVDSPPDFRRRGDALPFPMVREMQKARERRLALLSVQTETRHELPAFDRLIEDPRASAIAFWRACGKGDPWSTPAQPGARLKMWSDFAESLGVLVFHMSRIDPEVCQGVSLYFSELPVIILNGADDAETRIFTLWHEMAHILSRRSGICDLGQDHGVERACNAFAAEILMPAPLVSLALRSDDATIRSVQQRLASEFAVSWSAMVVRLRDLGQISDSQMGAQLAEARLAARKKREATREKAKQSSGGPPHYLIHLRNLSPRYVGEIVQAWHADRISAVDAAVYLEAKLATIDRMEATLQGRVGKAGSDILANVMAHSDA